MLSDANKAGNSDKHPVDSYYDQLQADIDVLDKNTEEFSLLQKYVSNTHAATHGQYDLEILEVIIKQFSNFISL